MSETFKAVLLEQGDDDKASASVTDVGVDALPNDENGAIGGVPLQGPWEGLMPWITPLHQAQVSVVYPSYPRRDAEESEANHR